MNRLKGLEAVDGDNVQLLPPEIVDMQVEILTHHPELVGLLREIMQANNYGPEFFYGTVAAYCGIVLEGNYSQKQLIEELSNALIGKRSIVQVIGANTIKVSKELLM